MDTTQVILGDWESPCAHQGMACLLLYATVWLVHAARGRGRTKALGGRRALAARSVYPARGLRCDHLNVRGGGRFWSRFWSRFASRFGSPSGSCGGSHIPCRLRGRLGRARKDRKRDRRPGQSAVFTTFGVAGLAKVEAGTALSTGTPLRAGDGFPIAGESARVAAVHAVQPEFFGRVPAGLVSVLLLGRWELSLALAATLKNLGCTPLLAGVECRRREQHRAQGPERVRREPEHHPNQSQHVFLPVVSSHAGAYHTRRAASSRRTHLEHRPEPKTNRRAPGPGRPHVSPTCSARRAARAA